MAVRIYLERFASYTSMHGFSRIVASKAMPKRIAWIIIFTTAWIFFTIQMSLVLRSYFKYPKRTTTEIVSGGVPFPAITLCNLGSFDFYAVYRLTKRLETDNGNEEGDIEDILDEETEHETEYESEYDYADNEEQDREGEEIQAAQIAAASSLNDTFTKAMYKYYNVVNKTRLKDSYNFKVLSNKLFSRTTLAANIPYRMLSANGVQENEFIVKCSFRNKPCKFKKIFDPYFFNCFTFTPPNVTSSNSYEDQPLLEGIDNGFSVMLLAGTKMLKDVDSFDYNGVPGIYSRDSPLSGAGGVRVVIHPPGLKPFPMTEGYDVPPEHMASLGITLRRQKRLGQPHGFCNENYLFIPPEMQPFAQPYRKTACEKFCIQKNIYRKCKCFANTLPLPAEFLNDDFYKRSGKRNIPFKERYDECFQMRNLEETNSSMKPFCKITEKCSGTTEFRKCFRVDSDKPPNCDDEVLTNLVEKIDCAENVKINMITNATFFPECECHPACNSTMYDVSYSLSQWPSKGIDGVAVGYEIMNEIQFTEKFASEKKKEFYEAYVDKDFKRALKDFSKINVYISNADVLLTSEEPAMTLTQLVSDTGGQLGVWIGVSVITIAEVLELLIVMMIDCCRNRSGKKDEADVELKDVTTGDV